MAEISKKMINDEAVAWIKEKVNMWSEAQVQVTENVSYDMRNVIEKARKNYLGVYENPTDEATGREKVWYPLTESIVENVIKNIDVDTKDINLRGKNPTATAVATIDRKVVRDQLRDAGIGEFLDMVDRHRAIDGTSVVKTWIGENFKGEKALKFKIVDNLNFFIDPRADNIQEADGVIERHIMDINEYKSQKGWKDTDKVVGSTNLNRTYNIEGNDTLNNIPEVDVYEYYGLFPKSWISGEEEDKDKYTYGQIIVSGLDDDAGVLNHIEERDDRLKPYEEVWYTRINGRWHGRGIPEKLFMIQSYINETLNLRINNSRIMQVGLFKARKGQGITQRSLSNLVAGGVLLVNDLNDIEQFNLNNGSLGDSIQDEQNMIGLAQRVTSSFDVSTGETLPSTTTATSAAISNQNVKSAFALLQEGMGMFLQRWIDRHVLPNLKQIITQDDIVRITGDVEDLLDIDEAIINASVNRAVADYVATNASIPSPEMVEIARERAQEKLKKQGKDRYFKSDVFLSEDYDTEVFVTNEDFDKNTIVQNILTSIFQLSQVSPNLDVDGLTVEVLDILGVGGDRFIKPGANEALLAQQQGSPGATPEVEGEPSAGDLTAQNQAPSSPGALIAQSQQQAPEGTL
jgi:hypothetical protein